MSSMVSRPLSVGTHGFVLNQEIRQIVFDSAVFDSNPLVPGTSRCNELKQPQLYPDTGVTRSNNPYCMLTAVHFLPVQTLYPSAEGEGWISAEGLGVFPICSIQETQFISILSINP